MIREYREADIEDILNIWLRASGVAHPFLTRAFLSAEEERIRSHYLPIAHTWVWEEEGRVVGFISVIDDEVGALFVSPEQHGRGIGTALMDTALALHQTLEVDVFEANPIGRSFYAKYGFELIDQHVHAETGEPALRLRFTRESLRARDE